MTSTVSFVLWPGESFVALGVTLTRRWGRPAGVSPTAFAGWQLTAGGLFLLPVTFLAEGAPTEIGQKAALGYLWLGLVGGLITYMFSVNVGVVNITLSRMGYQPISILGNRVAFLPLVVASAIWKEVGWGAIIYLAAITGINPELYEAATVDGANRFQRVLHITIPSITPVIVVMLILQSAYYWFVWRKKRITRLI